MRLFLDILTIIAYISFISTIVLSIRNKDYLGAIRYLIVTIVFHFIQYGRLSQITTPLMKLVGDEVFNIIFYIAVILFFAYMVFLCYESFKRNSRRFWSNKEQKE